MNMLNQMIELSYVSKSDLRPLKCWSNLGILPRPGLISCIACGLHTFMVFFNS